MFAVADAEKILRKIDLNYLFVDSKMELYFQKRDNYIKMEVYFHFYNNQCKMDLYFQKWLGLKRWFHDQLI